MGEVEDTTLYRIRIIYYADLADKRPLRRETPAAAPSTSPECRSDIDEACALHRADAVGGPDFRVALPVRTAEEVGGVADLEVAYLVGVEESGRTNCLSEAQRFSAATGGAPLDLECLNVSATYAAAAGSRSPLRPPTRTTQTVEGRSLRTWIRNRVPAVEVPIVRELRRGGQSTQL